MAEENATLQNQSSLLDSSAIKTNHPDDIPIGGSKFNFSEYPSENDAPIQPKKPPVRKSKQPKKEESEQIIAKLPQPLDEIPVGANNAGNNFDDKPIVKTNFMLSEFPEGEQAPVVQTTYSMPQMLKSKANKLKLQGMEAMLKMLEEDPENPELSDVAIAGLLKETVPANLQKILQCLVAWMDKGKPWGQDEARNTVEYGYINGKVNNKKQALEIADKMYQIRPEIIEMVMLTGFKSKSPKNIAGYIALLNELIAIYGVKRMKYLKPYLSEVVKVISTEKLPAVKTQGLNTLKQAYKWMSKDVVQPMLKDLKEGLKKELDTFWQAYDKTIVMTAPKDIPDQATGKSKGKKMDAYDLSEAVDIFKKYNEKWSESVINAPKWNQKTKLMEDFVKDATVPKLANTDFRAVTEVIRRLINDSNFNVVLNVLKMIGVMAKGLRRPFAAAAKSNFSNVIAKFRDKKTQMIDETFKTLSDLSYCLSIEDVLQDIKEGFSDKAPNMRINMIIWIGKYVEQKADEKGGQCPEKTRESLKQLFPIFKKLLTEGVAEVRQTMVKCMGKLQMFLGEEFFAPIKVNINKNLMGKIDSKPDVKLVKQEDTLSKSQVKAVSQSTIKESKILPKVPQKQKEETVRLLQCFDQPTFEQSLQTLIHLGYPEQQVKKISSASASDRGTILNYFRDNPYECFNEMLRVIRKVYKDWKEVNLSMNKDFIAFLEERQTDIAKPQAYILIPYILEKVGDSKFTESLSLLTTQICSRVSPKFITGHIIRYIRSTEGRKPKLNSDAASLLSKIIDAVSLANCDSKQIAQYAKQTFSVQFSRKGAIQLLLIMYLHSGDALKLLLDEQTLKGMEAEFKSAKILSEDQKRPKIQFQGEAAVQCKIPISKKNDSKSDGKVRDLSGDVQRLLPKMNDNSNWQNRKEAAEMLSSLIEQGGKVNFGNPTDLLATLKTRINDPNKQLIKHFVHLTGLVLCALPEKDLKFCAKNFITGIVEGLNDKNQLNKKQIHTTLSKLAQTVGKQAILTTLGPYLEGDKEGRMEIISLILNMEDGIAKADIKDYAKGIAICLCDKNKDIRAGAEKVFEKVYEKLGIQCFRNIAKSQRPAVASDLNTFLDRFDRNNATTSSFNSKGPSPSKLSEKSNKEPIAKQRLTMTLPQQQPSQQPPLSAKKRSLSRNNTQKSFLEGQDDMNAVATGSFVMTKRSQVEGNEFFASLKILAAERGERQADDEAYHWRLDQIKEAQEQSVREEIERLVRGDVAKKLLSFDYKRVTEAVVQLIRLSKDLTYQAQIKELYDVLLKWILLRLWGGQPCFITTIELVAPLLSILQKKKLALTDFEVDLVVAIIRQYFISALMVSFKFSESLYSILKCLVALSSGEKVLKKVLRLFSVQLSVMHKHLRKESCQLYREAFSKLVKNQLIDYVGTEDTLEEASRIKQLKEDPQFIEMLYRRFQENVLSCYGFKRNLVIASNNNSSFVSDIAKDKSVEKMQKLPPKGHPNSNTTGDLRPSNLPARKQNGSISQINPPISQVKIQEENHIRLAPSANQFLVVHTNPYESSKLSVSSYNAPHPAAPMGKQLNKLLPPSQQTIGFFTTLFQQSSQKIVNELTSYSKYIYGSILKSVQDLIASRKDYMPDKIVAQITLLQNCIKCPHIVRNVGQLLGFGTSFALTQLVYEDQNKLAICEELRSRNIDYKSDNFIKAINGVMLRLLENSNQQDIVNVLLQLLTVHSRAQPQSPKTISLIIKCLGRVAANFTKDQRPQATKTFFVLAIQYLSAVQYETALEEDLGQRDQNRDRLRPEDTAANAIKNIIIQLCKAYGSEIWEVYEKAMMESKVPDRYISSFITTLNVKVPQKQRGRSQQGRENEQLRRINELLSKTKSYEAGITQLRKYVQKHSEFNPYEYFTSLNYDQKFIAMVVKSLDGGNRLTPAKDRVEQPQENIQDKIQKLKRKFQDLQPESTQEANNGSLNRGRPGVEEEQREERAQEIKRRIEEMKNKMTSAVSRRP